MKQLLLVGSPNSGKSLLFNDLTGLNQRVANFPGITVNTYAGTSRLDPNLEVVDYPGVYSLHHISGEEEVAVKAFYSALEKPIEEIAAVVCVLDSTRLEKGLFLALQVIEQCARVGFPVVLAANMTDVLERHDLNLDEAGLSEALGVPVIGLSARTGRGIDRLSALLSSTITPPAVTSSNLIATDGGLVRTQAESLATQFGPKGDMLLVSHSRADSLLLHPVLGGISFVLIMYTLFQSIFTWAAPLMDAVESAVIWSSNQVVPLIPEGWMHDFVADAIFGGLGAFLVFVPQIFILTFVVGLLEDSGYLSRAAVICHRPLRLFGLTGKSFVPMLSGVACAIPGIYAARTIESRRRRWLTYLAIPLMPCSARLPVYGLLIAAFIPAQSVLGGYVGLQGLAMFAIYLFGICSALLVTALVSTAGPKQLDDTPFVLEMPPYRLPGLRTLVKHAWSRGGDFIKRAGPVIFWVSMVIWALGYFPNFGEDLGRSYLGALGQWLEPMFAPLGLDWKYGVAIIVSFLAREVFVGTLGTLYGIEGSEENTVSLVDQMTADGVSAASGLALVAFFVLAAQCISTLATLKRETGSWRLPVQLFFGYGLVAYCAAWAVHSLAVSAGL